MTLKPVLCGVLTLWFMAGPVMANQDFNVNEKVDSLKKELVLTDDQAKVVKEIFEEYKTKTEQAGKEKQDKLGQVLTPDQMNKMTEMKKAWKKG